MTYHSTPTPLSNSLRATSVMLLMSVVFAYILANCGLLLGIRISGLTFPLAVACAVAFGLYFSAYRALWKTLALYFGIIGCSLGCAMLTMDYSWDGIMYHQEIIELFAGGWNPFRVEELSSDYMLWTCHYAKAIETVAATIVATFGPLEIGKAVNYILDFATFLIVWDIVEASFPAWRKRRCVALALAIVCNPIVICQIYTYYIDYTKYIYLVWTLLLIYDVSKVSGRCNIAVLSGVIILAIGTKFNICFEEGVWLFMGICWLWYRKNQQAAKRLFVISIISLFIGIVLTYHPYITNIITGGHPLYPLLGEDKVDIMTDNTPAIFGHGRVADFFISLFSMNWPTNDQPIGGFGPFMPVVLACSAYILIKSRKFISADVLFIIAVCFLSCFFFEQSWWARYIAQLWFVPALLLFVSYKAGKTRIASGIMLGCMLLTIPISQVHGAKAIRLVHLYRGALYEALRNDTVLMVKPQVQFESMLQEHDVQYKCVDAIPDSVGGDILYFFGYASAPDGNEYPLLVLDGKQTELVRGNILNNNLDYSYFRYRTEK